MRLIVPEGMAPAAVYDATTRQYLCRDCADRFDPIVLVDDDTHGCVDCGEAITCPEVADLTLALLVGGITGQGKSAPTVISAGDRPGAGERGVRP
jgi:hypothetical protein